jgi:type I restriction enzyme, S subunit
MRAPNQWRRVPISETYLGLFDGPHATPKPSNEGAVFLGIGNITEDGHLDLSSTRRIAEEELPRWTRRVEPRYGDIVFTYEATLNRYAIIPDGFRGCLGRRLALIRPNLKVVDTRFLHFYFFSADWRATIASNTLSGATVERVPLTRFPNFPISLPPLEKQRRIASILSAYDDLIENNTRRIAILEEMARRIYEEWFMQFRFPGHEGVRRVESELGLVPEGWQLRSVADVAWVHRGRSYKGSELADVGGKPFVNLKCIERDGGFRSSGLKRYTGIFKETHTVRSGEMVMGVTDMTQERRIVARAARVSQLGEELGVISMDLVRIATRGELAEPYLYGMFRWSGFADEVKQYANGANVLHLHPSRIEAHRFVCPPKELADRFTSTVLPMLSLCDLLEQQATNLRATRDFLLPKLISGELDVSELPAPGYIAA